MTNKSKEIPYHARKDSKPFTYGIVFNDATNWVTPSVCLHLPLFPAICLYFPCVRPSLTTPLSLSRHHQAANPGAWAHCDGRSGVCVGC